MRCGVAVLAVCVVCSICACEKVKESFGGEVEQTKTVVVLFDLSGSTTGPQRKKYDTIFARVLQRVGYGDAIVVAKITASSITEPEIPVKEEFRALQLTGNALRNKVLIRKADEAMRLQKKAISAIVKKVLFSQQSGRTDIMGSLHLAGKIFKSYKHDRAILVLMSDMLEDSQVYNFSRLNLTQEKVDSILDSEKKSNRLPDLRNVKVYVIAAGKLDTEKFYSVQRFWMQYLSACGATADSANYVNDLLRFAE